MRHFKWIKNLVSHRKEEEERIRQALEQEAQAEQQREELLNNRRKEKAAMVESVGEPPASAECIVIAFKLPNGSRVLRRFADQAKVSDLYDFADTLQDNTYVKYSLVTSFPRRVLSNDLMDFSLHEAELHPQTQLLFQSEED